MYRQLSLQLSAVLILLWPHVALSADNFNLSEVAPGVFVHFGKHEEANGQNLGDIANIGFIVGSESIAVIDAGGSVEIGRRLRESIGRHSFLPIRYLIISHIHPDHTLGSPAFAEDQPDIIGHFRLPQAITQRGEFYIDRFKGILGDHNATTILSPNLLVESEMKIDLGNRILLIKAHQTAHTDNDLSIYDENTKSLWLADLLFLDRTPAIDGSTIGWINTLKSLQKVSANVVIPGHGDIVENWPEGSNKILGYFVDLVNWVRNLIQNGESMASATRLSESAEAGDWLLFDDYHPRNVVKTFAELEWE